MAPTLRRYWLSILAFLPAHADIATNSVWDADGFNRVAAPFLAKHCEACHGAKKTKGEFRVDTHLARNFLDPLAKEKWGEIVNVLNGHEMPPEDEPQPAPAEVAAMVDWITDQMVKAELIRRDGAPVLRRLNRDEYRNTIRDLVGIDYDPVAFPVDPLAGGFDNNGRALVFSPLHVELYLDAARTILDRALVEGDQPAGIHWKFEPEEGDGDSHRVRLPDKQHPIVHGGKNRKEGVFTVMHHSSWDLVPNARDFKVPTAGEYIIRVRAGGRVPDRAEVVRTAEVILAARRDKQNSEKPERAVQNQRQMDSDLEHFKTDRMYGYGPPRLRLLVDQGGQPTVVADFDVDAPKNTPKTFEFRVQCTTEKMGIRLEYAYSIPSVLENFWMQSNNTFARPEVWLDSFEVEGPVCDAWPPASHRKLLPESPLRLSDERAYASEVLGRFLARAYRRPPALEELQAKLNLFDLARKNKATFVQAIKSPLIATLASPGFLFLCEPAQRQIPAPSSRHPRRISDFELATRLSYFLWSSMPDEELIRLAHANTLHDPRILRGQVDRMLKDGKSRALAENFAAQWLGLREVGANPPAQDLYPHYDRHLESSMIEEGKAFFLEVLQQDLSVMNFVRSDFVVINERLARLYGMENVKGDHFRAVKLPQGIQRGGVATMPAVLTITSNGTRTSPVKRGGWVMKNLLGVDPGLPVANVGDIQPKVPGIDKATVRQRLAIHRELPQCARCHDRIDPLGLALEKFNAAGEWREQEGFGYKGRIQREDPRIDASAQMPDGTEFSGVDGLQKALLAKEDLFLGCLTGKMFTYALGRELGVADQPMVKNTSSRLKQDQYRLRSLIHHVVASEAFQTK
jgi:mono/diheme cytochrome c family protein